MAKVKLRLKGKHGHNIIFDCDACGNEVIRKEAEFRKMKHHFCNHFCHNVYRADNKRGK